LNFPCNYTQIRKNYIRLIGQANPTGAFHIDQWFDGCMSSSVAVIGFKHFM
jgi:hypothetical protein